MSPDTLASLLATNPYPGCEVARGSDSILLGFDGLALNYRADGWHFGGTHLESTLSDYSAPEQVHPEIRRILKVVMSLKVERALNEAEADGTTDPVAYLTNLAAEKMLAILDVAALANARQAKIASNVAEAAARDIRIAVLERDLASKPAALKTAHARAKAAEQALKDIDRSLGAAGAPQAYTDDGEKHPIPPAERVLLLGERARAEHAERIREGDRADIYRQRIADADFALDRCGASRLADGCVLSLAARIRAIPQ